MYGILFYMEYRQEQKKIILPKRTFELFWNTRGKAVKVDHPTVAREVRKLGFRKITDPRVNPGQYNPVYDQGPAQEFKEILPKIEQNQKPTTDERLDLIWV